MYLSLLKIGRLFHLISKKKYKKLKQVYVIKKSPLFDAKWYLQQYPDVKTYKSGPAAHYLEYGWKEGRNPSERFDSKIYLNENLDVQNGQLNPLYHYEKFGKFEGRSFNECESIDFTDKRKIEKRRNLFQKIWNFFDNIRYTGKSEDYKLISKSKYFDKHWYLKTYPDVKGKDPVEHYLKYGWKEGKNPGPLFDGAIYFDFHKNVAKVGINPLRHYEKHKIDEKRICNVSFPAHRNIFQLIKSTFFYKEPKFSIIVASYNYEKYIKKTLDSILAQTYKNFEIIVIDDGSSDNSVATIKKYVKKYDNIKLYRHKKGINKGLPASLELGISKCNGDYIGFCESDDFWTKDHLEEYVKIIKKYAAPEIITNDCKCFGSTVELVNKKQRYIVDRNRWIFQQKNKKKFSFHEFKENNYITTFSAVMVKATVLKKCNFLTPRKAAIDWWLWRQLAFHHPVYFINKKITMWRIHESYLETSTEEKKLYHQCFIHRMDKILKDKNYLNKISKKDYKIIKNSKHFDENYYRNTYGIKDCIKHYYTYGWRMGYNPSLNFSTNDYLELNPEVIKSDVCPLIHYEVFGRKQWNRYIKEKVINQKVIDQYWKERKCYPNRNIVQYTCMTGGYDNFIISDYFDPKYDYVLFTDNKKLLKEEYFGVWKCQPLKYTGSDNVRISRWHKTHPHELFSKKYKYSLWCDSNQNFLTDYIYKLIEKHIKNGAKIAAFKHYCRDCLYEEAIECKNQRKDNIDIINSQILKYQKDGFPKHYGLFETGLIFREHNNPKVKKIDNDWFSEISKYSRRDQLSFTYALWKNRFCCALFDKKNLREIDSEVELFKHLIINKIKENRGMTITVIIPIYNALEDVKTTLNSLEESELSEKVKVILVNDCSNKETSDYLKNFVLNKDKYILLQNRQNLGFVKTCNKGIAAAQSDLIILLNSDTIIPKNFENRILNCFASDDMIGVASPLSSSTGLWDLPLKKGMTYDQMDAYVEKVSDCAYPDILCPEGFCFCVRKKVIDKVGKLDEIFGRGYCEETDLVFRILDAGYRGVLIDNLYVYHKRHASFGLTERNIQMKKNNLILWNRWRSLYEEQIKKVQMGKLKEHIKELIYTKEELNDMRNETNKHYYERKK